MTEFSQVLSYYAPSIERFMNVFPVLNTVHAKKLQVPHFSSYICIRFELQYVVITCYMCLVGAFYNIIRVPPKKEDLDDTLQAAKILCSISPAEKNKPSYYHSFGKCTH